MCDDRTDRDIEQAGLSRRTFTAIATGAVAATALPAHAALATSSQKVLVDTPDGKADAFFVHPASGKHPGVILWPDVYGLRPAFEQMATRLASEGYAVLAVNPFYRNAKAPVLAEGQPRDAAAREKIAPMRAALTAEAVASDARAFVAFLDGQGAVDASRKLGSMGYCMGGNFTVRTAAAAPGRVGAGASFHGGLVSEAADSPHLLISQAKAAFLVAIAENDDQRAPDHKDKVRAAMDEARLPAEIEVYPGTMHGWCVIDSQVHNVPAAERAWERMLALYKSNLV